MNKTQGNQEENECKAALRSFANKSFSRWKGLPSSCKLSEAMAIFTLLNEGVGTGYMGSKKVRFRMFVVKGYSTPVRVWFEEDILLMLDVEYPEIPDGVLSLLKQLGEPDVQLDFFWDVLRLERGEWVYAERGLALLINPGNNFPLRLSVFPPTTVDDYMKRLRLDRPMRELPVD